MDVVEIEISRLPHAPLEYPEYQTEGSVGMDLRLAAEDMRLEPGVTHLLPTGFCIAIPAGFEGQVRMRSSFARRTGVILPNAPGTIDPDYRGELKVLVMNVSREAVTVKSGERFAQLVISPVARCRWQGVVALKDTPRSQGGFGSTGTR